MNFLPPNSNVFDLANLQRLAQLNQYNQQNVYVQQQADIYTELQNKLNQLPIDEKQLVVSNDAFIMANSSYEQSLLAFIASQYRTQFNQSEQGQMLLKNLETATNSAIEASRTQLTADREELKRVSDLIKQNPEILDLIKDTKSK